MPFWHKAFPVWRRNSVCPQCVSTALTHLWLVKRLKTSQQCTTHKTLFVSDQTMAFHGLQLYSLLASPNVKRIQTPWLLDKAENLCHVWSGWAGASGVTVLLRFKQNHIYTHTFTVYNKETVCIQLQSGSRLTRFCLLHCQTCRWGKKSHGLCTASTTSDCGFNSQSFHLITHTHTNTAYCNRRLL